MTATTAAATSQELSHLARPLDHHAQGPNIPFGESLTSTWGVDSRVEGLHSEHAEQQIICDASRTYDATN